MSCECCICIYFVIVYAHLNVWARAAGMVAERQGPPVAPCLLGVSEAYVLGIIAPGSFLVGLGAVIALRYYERHNPSSDSEVVDRQPENLDEDVYGAGVATLVRDSFSLIDGKGDLVLRISRLSTSLLLMVFVIALQVFVILQMQALVASRAVTEIRQIYGRYEFVMYGAEMSHVYLTPNGFPRGTQWPKINCWLIDVDGQLLKTIETLQFYCQRFHECLRTSLRR